MSYTWCTMFSYKSYLHGRIWLVEWIGTETVLKKSWIFIMSFEWEDCWQFTPVETVTIYECEFQVNIAPVTLPK